MSIYNFFDRHVGSRGIDISTMLETVKASSIKQLIDETIPQKIHLKQSMNLPSVLSESRFIEHMKEIAQKNKNYRSYIGMGYFNTILPGVIQRNVLEENLEECSKNPLTGWLRDGCCNTDENDIGVHTVCVKVNNEFLESLSIR